MPCYIFFFVLVGMRRMGDGGAGMDFSMRLDFSRGTGTDKAQRFGKIFCSPTACACCCRIFALIGSDSGIRLTDGQTISVRLEEKYRNAFPCTGFLSRGRLGILLKGR